MAALSDWYKEVFVISTCRTGIGSFLGQFYEQSSITLGSAVIKTCVQKLHLHGSEISQVIMGQVVTAGLGPNPASTASGGADLPAYVPASTINMDCASGLKAVCLGYEAIRFGSSKLVVCGGQESITRGPQTLEIPPGTCFSSNFDIKKYTISEGLGDGFTGDEMRKRANDLAVEYNISRAMQDTYAYESIQKAINATTENYFKDETVVVHGIYGDEILRENCNITLSKLMEQPTFLKETPEKLATISSGNSAKLGDGAAALLLCNRYELAILGGMPLAKIIDVAEVSLSPDQMGIGSVFAVETLLETVNWTKEDVDLYEIQETFAVQALIVIQKLNINPGKVNVSGGAIAFGHPIAASGARLLITLISNLGRLNLTKGVASICTGKGKAIAVAVEVPKTTVTY